MYFSGCATTASYQLNKPSTCDQEALTLLIASLSASSPEDVDEYCNLFLEFKERGCNPELYPVPQPIELRFRIPIPED